MDFAPKLAFAAFLLCPSLAYGQGTEASLKQAQTTFDVLDANKDAKLSPQEMLLLKITAADARGIDFDMDGSISKDEFVMFYRQRLVAAGVRPAADLEAEAVRILAARKAREANRSEGQGSLSQARRNALRTGQQSPSSPESGGHDAVLEAFDRVQAKANLGQAAKQDFDQVREALAARTQEADRAAKGGEPQSGDASEVYRKLLQSLDRLQAAAAAGKFSREEYQAVRESFVQRARLASGGAVPAPANSGDAVPNPGTQAIEKGLVEALDRLEQRAAAGGATREDFQRVRDQLIARARAAASDPSAAQIELQGPVHRKLIQSLDRLEAAAQQGVYSREQYQELRDTMVHRARGIANPDAAQAPDVVASNGSDASLQGAFDALERHVDAGRVTHEDFQGLQDQLMARVKNAQAADQANDADTATYRRLMRSLTRLEAAARDGLVDRAEFQSFKDSFVKRARGIERDAQQAAAPDRSGSPATGRSSGGAKSEPGSDTGGNAGESKPVPVEGRTRREEPAGEASSKGVAPGTQPAPQRPKPVSPPAPASEKPKPSRPPTPGGGDDKPAERERPPQPRGS